MTPRLRKPLLCLALLALALPALPCGPDFPEAIFVRQFGPDAPYSAFTAGRLGVPRITWRVRHLAIAYDILTHRPLSPAEQAGALAANRTLRNDTFPSDPLPPPGLTAWLKARTAFGPVDAYLPTDALDANRTVPGENYQSFQNCLDDAFRTAAATLADRAAAHGLHSPDVTEWVRGQDQVFRNCSDTPGSFTADTYHPATPPPTTLPSTLPNAPVWLAQDRTYQIAAAHFYALQFPQAQAAFHAIAADPASPWSAVANYLTARNLLRQASLSAPLVPESDAGTPLPPEEHAAFLKVQAALASMRSEPRMAPLRHSIDGLFDYLALRLDPKAQRLVLATRLQSPGDPAFGQDLIDLTFATTHLAPPRSVAPLPPSAAPAASMLAFLDTIAATDGASALANWRSTHATPWLLAAFLTVKPADPALPDLSRAAQAIPASDPAATALTYLRLAAQPRSAATRAALLEVLPSIAATQGASTNNLFAALNAATAPSLDAWLQTAGRIPAAVTDEGDESGEPALASPASTPSPKPAEQPCGPPLFDSQIPLFTPPAADALNRRLPLNLLAQAAETNVLSPSLRFALAQAVWTRAVLLDQPSVAHRMTPLLVACRAAWKPVLTTYDAATTPAARHLAGLFALMRFASTEPNVRAGEPRPEGFATYSVFRDNWWANTVAPARNTVLTPESSGADRANAALSPDPLLFLTPADRTTAQAEIASLDKIPPASDFFAAEALAWFRAHPSDPANADLLGQAMRVARIAPQTSHTSANEQALVQTLQRTFPHSSWAAKYTTWD